MNPTHEVSPITLGILQLGTSPLQLIGSWPRLTLDLIMPPSTQHDETGPHFPLHLDPLLLSDHKTLKTAKPRGKQWLHSIPFFIILV